MPSSIRSAPFLDLGPMIGGLPGALIAPSVTIRGSLEVSRKIKMLAKQFGTAEPFLMAAANGYRNFMVTNYLSGQRLKRRSGRLVSSWQAQLVDENTPRVSPGVLPYARVHEYGLDYPFQPVRGYTTRAGRQLRMYFRDMKLKATHYVTDTVRLGGKYVHAQIDAVVKRMGSA